MTPPLEASALRARRLHDAIDHLHGASTRAGRVQRATREHLAGGLGTRVEQALAAQRRALVRAERDLEDVVTAIVRSAK